MDVAGIAKRNLPVTGAERHRLLLDLLDWFRSIRPPIRITTLPLRGQHSGIDYSTLNHQGVIGVDTSGLQSLQRRC